MGASVPRQLAVIQHEHTPTPTHAAVIEAFHQDDLEIEIEI
jgi:hypothetical protein